MDNKNQLESISKVLSTMAFALIVILGTRQIAQDLIVPILLAGFLTVLLFPIYKWFRKRNIPSGLSVVLMIITFILGFALVAGFVVWSFTLISGSVSAYVDSLKNELTQATESVPVDQQTLQDLIGQINPEAIAALLGGIAGNLGTFVMYFIIIPMLAILMLVQIDKLPAHTADLISQDSTAIARMKKFSESIIAYLSGRLKVNVVTGLLFAAALFILGVDYAFVWGILVVLLSFIPYIGLIIAGTPPTLLAFAEYGVWGAIAVIASIVIINLFAENILDPYVQGKGSKISTAAIIIALIFWTWLFGPVGALLSVPLTVSIKFILAEYRETRWIALLMEGNYQEATVEAQNPENEKLLNKMRKQLKFRKKASK